MPTNPRTQRKSRADAKLDASVVADYEFFNGQNRTKKHKAAILLAEDDLTDRQIAALLGISRSTLSEWKQHPDFAAVRGNYEGEIIAEALKLPIAKKHQRIRELNDLNERYHQIISQRAETYAKAAQTPEEAARQVFGSATPPWAATGMYMAQQKISAGGITVTDWVFDKALDSAIKETHKQAATELGQWEENLNVNHSGLEEQEYVIVREIPWGDDGDGDE